MIASLSLPRKALETFHRYRHAGVLTEQDGEQQHAYLVIGKQGHYLIGNCVILYWLVDKQSGKVLDAKFQYFGHPHLLILAETSCSIVIGKPCSEALQLSFEELDRTLQSSPTTFSALPHSEPLYHMVLDAIDALTDECKSLSLLPQEELAPSNQMSFPSIDKQAYAKEAWDLYSLDQRVSIIKSFIEEHIAPFVAMDGGQVIVEHLDEHHVVTIAYSGNCSSCFSSLGSTLNSISQLLRTHIYAELRVKVNESSLNLSDMNPPPPSA